jgi:hypothetical protein
MFRLAITLHPEGAASYYGLGRAMFGLGDTSGAIDAWLTVDRLDPNYDYQSRIKFINPDDTTKSRPEEHQDTDSKGKSHGRGFWGRLFGGS